MPYFLCLAVMALVTLGLVMLASTSVWNKDVDGYSLVKKQAVFIALGLLGAVVISNVDYQETSRFLDSGAGDFNDASGVVLRAGHWSQGQWRDTLDQDPRRATVSAFGTG